MQPILKPATWKSRAPRQRKVILWVAGLLAFYTVAGFFIAPPIVRSVAAKQLSQRLGREVSIRQVKLNPYSFSASIRGLLIKEHDGQPFLAWDEVYVNLQLASLFGDSWILREVSATKPLVRVRVNEDGTFNFTDVLANLSSNAPPANISKPTAPIRFRIDRLNVLGATVLASLAPQKASAPAEPAAPLDYAAVLSSITNAIAGLAASTNSLAGTIREINFTNCAVTFEDAGPSRPVRLVLDNIEFTARDVSNLARTNIAATLSLRWDTNGTVKVDVAASLAPVYADVQASWDKLELRPLDPYLESALDVFIIGSKLSGAGRVRLTTTNGGPPDLALSGSVRLGDFSTVDGVLAEDLLKWTSVDVTGIEVGLNPPAIAIRQIAVNDVYARVIIETNRTINLMAALHMTETNAPEEEGKEPSAAGAAPVASTPAPAASRTNSPPRFPMPAISIETVVITNAVVRFTDRSVTPNVNLAIEQARGTITGISSAELQHGIVDLHAEVDNVGPAAITGVINPFRKDQTNELNILISDVDLMPTSPYVAKFAGRRLARGKLGMKLAYHIHDRKLKSENVIILDQFTFGEKVDSPDATKLPVEFAIAVLKDRQGKIELDVPIEGSLDDPKLRIRKVVVRAIENVLTRVVTSPFSVLGAIFGGHGEELNYQEFTPGNSELLPAGKEKLDALVKGLYERPALRLDIEGCIDREADRAGLQRIALEKQIRTHEWMTLRKSDRTATTPEQVTLTPEDRLRWITKMYAEALSKGELTSANPGAATNQSGNAQPAVPLRRSTAPVESVKGATFLMRGAEDLNPSPQQSPGNPSQPGGGDPMEQALAAAIAVSDGDLQTLASDRAKAVREYILQTGKVEGERLFLVENPPGGTKTAGSRASLQLK